MSRRKLLAITVALSLVATNPVINTYFFPACIQENMEASDENGKNKEEAKTKIKKRHFA